MLTNETLEAKIKSYGISFPFVRFPSVEIRDLLLGEMAPCDSLVGTLLVCVGRGFEEFTNAWFICDSEGDATEKALSPFSHANRVGKDLLLIAECNDLPFFVDRAVERTNVWYPGDDGELRRQQTLLELIHSFEYFNTPRGIPREEARNEWFWQHVWKPKRNGTVFDVRSYSNAFAAWLDKGLPTFPPPDSDFGFSEYFKSLPDDVKRKVFSDER